MFNHLKTVAVGVLLSGCVGETQHTQQTQREPVTHVIALMGQSNMGGKEPFAFSPNDERIKVLSLDNQIVTAKEPLFSSVSGELSYPELPTRVGTGSGLSFAVSLIETLPAGDSIILVPCARGGSAMPEQVEDGQTSATGVYYARSLLSVCKERIDLVLSTVKSTYDGALYFQGESDAINMASVIKSGGQIDYGFWTDGLMTIKKEMTGFGSDKFVMMQIGNFNDRSEDKPYTDITWEAMKQHQQSVSEKYNIPMVVTDDLARYDDIHLSGKAQITLGRRITEVFSK